MNSPSISFILSEVSSKSRDILFEFTVDPSHLFYIYSFLIKNDDDRKNLIILNEDANSFRYTNICIECATVRGCIDDLADLRNKSLSPVCFSNLTILTKIIRTLNEFTY